MHSFDRQGGAVHILFLIMVLVIALVFGALWFVQLQEGDKLKEQNTAVSLDMQRWSDRAAWYRDFYAEIGPLVGGGVPGAVPLTDDSMLQTPPSEVAAQYLRTLEADLRALGAQVDDASANPTTLREAWNVPINRYNLLKAELAQKNATISRLEAEKEQLNQTISSNTRAAEQEKAQIQQEHDGNLSRMNTQMSELRSQNEEVQTKIRDTLGEIDQAREQYNREVQGLALKTREFEGQVRQMKSELRIKRAREAPDGKIISVDPVSGIGIIDITSKEMLRRGTRFKVYETGKGGVKIHKGWVTATNIGPEMSEVRLDEQVAGTGGIGAGDWLTNPFYDRQDVVTFAFLGQLPGRYTREVAERILTGFGARVEDKVTVHTDFLVLGEKEDPDAPELSESDDYRNATTWGIEIIRAQDLAPFLQM